MHTTEGRKTLSWWRGNFQGLIACEATLALADLPDHPENAARIDKILSPNIKVTNTGANPPL